MKSEEEILLLQKMTQGKKFCKVTQVIEVISLQD